MRKPSLLFVIVLQFVLLFGVNTSQVDAQYQQRIVDDICNINSENCCHFKITGKGGVDIVISGPGAKDGGSDILAKDILVPSNTPLTITATSYAAENLRYLKIYQGDRDNGITIVERNNLSGSPATTTFPYSFPTIRQNITQSNPMGEAVYSPYNIGIRADVTGSDKTKCRINLVSVPDENNQTGLCCPEGYTYDNDGQFYQTIANRSVTKIYGRCYDLEKVKESKNQDDLGPPPRPCSLKVDPDTRVATWVMKGYIFNLCFQAGSMSGECSNCEQQGGIWTAIGCIPTDLTQLVATLIRFATSIAGGIALLLILYGAFTISASSGDPQKIGEGKEIITAAIAGLIFIIFSVAILQFIGIQIIQLPGLSS